MIKFDDYWKDHERATNLSDSGREDFLEKKLRFYSGAVALFDILQKMGDKEYSQSEGVDALRNVNREVNKECKKIMFELLQNMMDEEKEDRHSND